MAPVPSTEAGRELLLLPHVPVDIPLKDSRACSEAALRAEPPPSPSACGRSEAAPSTGACVCRALREAPWDPEVGYLGGIAADVRNARGPGMTRLLLHDPANWSAVRDVEGWLLEVCGITTWLELS